MPRLPRPGRSVARGVATAWGRRSLAGLVLLVLLALPQPTAAQSPRDLREAERVAEQRRQAAEAAAAEVRRRAEEEVRLAGQRVEAARRVQEAEAELAEARLRAAAARRDGQTAEAALAARAAAFEPLLPLILRLSLWPAETVLAVPAEPEDALRGALVLRGMVRQIEEEATALRGARDQAATALSVAEREAAALAAAERRARDASAALETALSQARRRRATAEAAEDRAAERAQTAAAQARDLAEVLQRLNRERQRREAAERGNAAARAAAEARRRAEESRERRLSEEARAPREAAAPRAATPPGGRTLPVAGRIATSWGEAGPGGPHRGLTFAAAPGSRVVTPCTGRAVFAAPFRTYGLLLIVDCGGGYHFVLAGLDRLDAAAGQRLLAGEPVGVLAGSGGSSASLYVELRRNGQPVDPRPWFAARG